MTKPFSVGMNAVTETEYDNTTLDLPPANDVDPFSGSDATVLPSLPYAEGDWIVLNKSPFTSIVLADGRSITFGSALVGGAYTGDAYNPTDPTKPYCGPYVSIAPSNTNLFDDATTDIQHLGTALAYDENTNSCPIHWVTGVPQVSGLHVLPGAIDYPHTVQGHHTRGHFVGGSFVMPSVAGKALFAVMPANGGATSDTFSFATDDGTGNSGTPGLFKIFGPLAFNGASVVVIGSHSVPGFASNFPDNGNNDILTFTTLFPPDPLVTSNPSGSLSPTDSYDVRVCYTRSWNGKTIESALSQVVRLTGHSGYKFTIGGLHHNWTGVRVYWNTTAAAAGSGIMENLSSSATYDGVSDITMTSVSGDTAQIPSYGFYAWPVGTDVTISGGAVMMKLGHVGGVVDIASSTWNLHGFHPNSISTTSVLQGIQTITGGQHIGGLPTLNALTDSAVNQAHMNSFTSIGGTTPEAAGSIPTADGSGGVSYQPGSGVPSVTAGVSGIFWYFNGGTPAWSNFAITGNKLPWITNGVIVYEPLTAAGAIVTTSTGDPVVASAVAAGDVLLDNGTGATPSFTNLLRAARVSVTLDASGNASGSVVFGVAFATTPAVSMQHMGAAWTNLSGTPVDVRWTNVSATGFDWSVTGAASAASTVVVMAWFAAFNP